MRRENKVQFRAKWKKKNGQEKVRGEKVAQEEAQITVKNRTEWTWRSRMNRIETY